MKKIKKAKHLDLGDCIGLVSPASSLAGLVPHRVKKGTEMIKKLGFNVKIGKNALKVTGHTAGSPKERAQDINDFFKDKSTKAIIAFIGGNHSNQLLKYLDFCLIRKTPKIFIGYSDTTVLHLAFYTQANLVTFYGPAVLTQFAENPQMIPYTEEYFLKVLTKNDPIGKVYPSENWTDEVLYWFKKEDLTRPRKMKKNNGWQWLKPGKTQGKILGGCITSMMHLRGTKYWPDFNESILFWEIPESEADFKKGESLANIESYLTDLELSGVFRQIKGMIIGRPFGYTNKQTKSLIDIIKKATRDYKFPILFGVDIGHSDPIITIPIGVNVKIDSAYNQFEILESGVI